VLQLVDRAGDIYVDEDITKTEVTIPYSQKKYNPLFRVIKMANHGAFRLITKMKYLSQEDYLKGVFTFNGVKELRVYYQVHLPLANVKIDDLVMSVSESGLYSMAFNLIDDTSKL